MQPSDSQPTPQPQKEEKVSFWAKLFGKKPKTPAVPPRESHTPAPQLGNDEPVTPGASPVDAGSVDSGTSPEPTSAPDTSTQVPPVDPGVASPAPGSDEQKPQQ